MANFRVLLPAIALAATIHAQLHAQIHAQIQDPANLAGERVSAPSLADTLPIDHGAPALQQLLLKLRTRASLMMIVAHPDDEDGGMLTYESRGLGARVAMLTLTRGEGGQNLMSADFDDALGLIRTQELLAADRYFGVDQMFGTEVDFGFSKTKEETLGKWTHDRVLYDAVRAVRLYRPLVLASVFVGGPTDGHGHHQVSGEICQEVFLAAADPKVFPEMIAEGLPAWAPLKVYARVPFSRVTPEGMYDYATGKTIPTRFHNYVTGVDTTTEPTATVEIHEGEKSTNPAMNGDSYVQFARRGLALQKTQIGSGVRLAPSGASDAGYTLMATRTPCTKPGCPTLSSITGKSGTASATGSEQSLFDGIDTSLPGMAALVPASPLPLRPLLEAIDQDLAQAQHLFNPARPELTAPPLQSAVRKLDALLHHLEESQFSQQDARLDLLHELRIKRVQLNNALVLALGISLTAQSASEPSRSDGSLLPGPARKIEIKLSGLRQLHLSSLTITTPSATIEQPAPASSEHMTIEAQGIEAQVNLPVSTPVTQPYFSRPNLEQPFYTMSNPNLRNAPATPSPLTATAHLDYQGVPLEIASDVVAAGTTHVVAIVPNLSVMVSPSVSIDPTSRPAGSPLTLTATVRSESSAAVSTLGLKLPQGWHDEPTVVTIPPAPVGTLKSFAFSLSPGKLAPDRRYEVTAVANSGTEHLSKGFRPVGYPGLTSTNFYTPATYRVTAVDVKTAPNLHVAYLPGTGDMVPEYLPNLGITPTILRPNDLTAANLKQYDAVVLGVRAYAAHATLEAAGSKPLLDYAQQGGVVILQYMTARYGDAEAPFPITVPGDPAHNVVEEAQPVTLLQPDNPLLTWPNRITAADFDHWVAERGHGFAATWDPHFTALTETHDLGQDPQRGGLLYARTGKGAYIYVAYALYRQLPEGVPGAYRLFANLLSLGKNPQR